MLLFIFNCSLSRLRQGFSILDDASSSASAVTTLVSTQEFVPFRRSRTGDSKKLILVNTMPKVLPDYNKDIQACPVANCFVTVDPDLVPTPEFDAIVFNVPWISIYRMDDWLWTMFPKKRSAQQVKYFLLLCCVVVVEHFLL